MLRIQQGNGVRQNPVSLLSLYSNHNNFYLQGYLSLGLEDYKLNIFKAIQLKVEEGPHWTTLANLPLTIFSLI